MIYVAFIIVGFTCVQIITALANLISQTHLPYTGRRTGTKLSVLIPARNEEKIIGNILNDLKKLRTENLEVIIFNDQSEDRTALVVNFVTRGDKRFRIINSGGLPEGWIGKNFACHSLAHEASGEYLLFLDADVRISGNIAEDSIQYAMKTGSDLVSIFPMQKIISPGEWATVPNMNYILVSLLPLALVRKTSFPSIAAANGQFMLFRSDAYRKTRPHELFKENKVEDIITARYFKNRGMKVSCLLGDERISCRMYTGFSEAVNGFSKNIAEFFGGSYVLALIFWLITTFGFIPVLLYLPSGIFFSYLTIYLLTRIAIAQSGRQNIVKNLLYILPLQYSMGMMIYRSLTNKLFKRYTWKGRSIG